MTFGYKVFYIVTSIKWQKEQKPIIHNMAGLLKAFGCLGPFESLVIKLSYNLS